MTCTFFGHRNCSEKIELKQRTVEHRTGFDRPLLMLIEAITGLIENNGVDLFYIGNQGRFDDMVYKVLRELSKAYSIEYYVVLAYLPVRKSEKYPFDPTDTLFPDGIETVPRRYAVCYRNKWMIRRADYVITHVSDPVGSGAAKFKSLAEKQGKTVINIE